MTFIWKFLIGLDQFGAVIFFDRSDVCISTLCRLQQLNNAAFASLNFSRWQVASLRWLAKVLDKLQTGHCAASLLSDHIRANSTLALLA